MLSDWSEADINHAKTIGAQPWVISIRNALSSLVDDLTPHFTGFVSNDFAKISRNDEEVKALVTGYKR